MKRSFFILLFLVGITSINYAQNSLEISVGEELCIDEIVATFTDASEETLTLGCFDDFFFDIGSLSLEYITFNGVVCPSGNVTTVKVKEGQFADVYVRPVGKITFKAKEGATLK